MPDCYSCDEPLEEKNSSKEHIFLNAIGGRLKPQTLLCEGCNTAFGSGPDTELANQLNIFSNFFAITRDRGEPQPIKASQVGTGDKYILTPGAKPALAAPKFVEKKDGETTKVSISASNDRHFRQALGKYPEIDAADAMAQAERKREYLHRPLHISTTFGGGLAFRSVCKTAVNWYIHSGGDVGHIRHLIPYLKGEIEGSHVRFYYPERDAITTRRDRQVAHSVIVKGVPSERLLAAYVEFFDAIRFLVVLNEDYGGPAFESSYHFDPVAVNEIHREEQFQVVRGWHFLPAEGADDENSRLIAEFQKVLGYSMQAQADNHRGDLINKALDNSLRLHPDGTIIDDTMINQLVDAVMEQIGPLIAHSVMRLNDLEPPDEDV